MKFQYRKRKQDSNGWRLTTLVSMPMCSLAPTVAGLSPRSFLYPPACLQNPSHPPWKTSLALPNPTEPLEQAAGTSHFSDRYTKVFFFCVCVTEPGLKSCLCGEATCYVRAICCWMAARDHHPLPRFCYCLPELTAPLLCHRGLQGDCSDWGVNVLT